MNSASLLRTVAAGSLALVATTFAMPRPAAADDASTAAIAGAAGLIIGGLLYDSNNRPYYDHGGRRVYVSDRAARDYRDHGGRYRDNRGHYHQDGGGDRHH